jgi:hypothetical protein
VRGTRKAFERKRGVCARAGEKKIKKNGKTKWGEKGKKMRGQRRAGLPCLVAFELVRKRKGAAA